MAAVVEGDTAEHLGAADQRLRTWSRQTRDVLDRIPEKEECRRREAAARASAPQDRRNRRRRALVRQLCLRIPTSLAYSAFAGTSLTAAVSHPHEPNWGLWWPNTLPVLEACSVTVALACLLDWFLDSPRGGCRYPVGGIGLSIGLWGCLRFTAYAPDFFEYGMLWVMPWSFGVAMMVATVLDWLISKADSPRYPENRASQTITKRAGARLLLTGLGAASGIGVLLLSPLSPSESFLRNAEAASARVTPLHVDILGIGGAPGMVVALAIVCNILHLTAAPLARVRPPLGIAAAVIGPLLGLLVFLAYPLNLVKIIIGGVIGMAS